MCYNGRNSSVWVPNGASYWINEDICVAIQILEGNFVIFQLIGCYIMFRDEVVNVISTFDFLIWSLADSEVANVS